MRSAFTKIRVLHEVWFAYMSAYRAEILIWILTGSVPLIMLAVWIGQTDAAGGAVQGFTAPDFAAYFLAAWLSQQMIVAWVSWELDFQIRMGQLSPKLLRPCDIFWEHLTMHTTERLVRLPFIVLILTAGIWIVPGTVLTPGIANVAAYLLLINLAFILRFLIAYCIGLLTFWFDQATALDELYFVIAALLTGSFAPLDLYPPAVRALIEWTPFPYLIYYPVRVLTGVADWAEFWRSCGILLVWVSLFVLLRGLLWQRGLRRYGAVGA